MTKWKLEIKAPFLGIAPGVHRNIVNDLWGTYWEANQSQMALGMNYDCTNPNYLAPIQKRYEVTGTSSTDLIQYISDYCIPYQSISENAYAISKTNLYYITQYGITTLKTVTNMVDGQSLVHFNNNLYYFYNTSSAGDIGKFNLTDTYDDDWGSTVPTGHAALELAIHPNTVYKNNLIFGNGRYLGKYNYVNNTLTPQYIDYGAGTLVTDVAVTGSYLFVSVVFPALWTKKRGFIYKYDALLTDIEPLDCINVKYEVTALHVMNGIIYVFYGGQSFSHPIEWFLGYISGSQVVPLRTYKGYSPKFNQVTEHRGYIAFMDSYGGTVYLYGQYDIGTNGILIPYNQTNNTTVGCLASPFNGLMFSGILWTTVHLYRLPYSSDVSGNYSKYSSWSSIAQIVGDTSNDSIIDNITVFTNVLGDGAGVTLRIKYPPSYFKTLEVTGNGISKHIFRNIDIPVDIFCLQLEWNKYSEINPCLIRKIIINGHTREK